MSEVMLSKLPFENSVIRIDAEYFKKKYLTEDSLREKYSNLYLDNFCFITDGQHGYHEVDESSPIRHLTAKNFKNWFADDNNADRLAKWVDDNNRRSALRENDIVVTTRGTVGYCAIVKNDVLPANIDQDVARIFLKSVDEITAQYLLVYVNCKFGQDWLKRNQTGMVQQGIALWRIKEMPIPKLPPTFQKTISEIVEQSFDNLKTSNQAYSLAEQILLAEIGLQDFEPAQDAVNIKNFSDSFQTSGRLDAEYYQKKYDDYINLVHSYKKGSEPIREACINNGQNFTPDAKTEYRYIELSNIGKSGDINGCTVNIGEELPSRARRLVSKNDVVISSIEGSLDSCALVTEEYSGALCSTGFYVLRSEKINSETLLVLFKSELMQNLLKQNCSGTILTAINKDEFLNIPVPLIDKNKQKQIAVLIKQSFALKKQSEQLLEVAKRAVEIAIEQDEVMALKYIQDNG